MSTGAYGNIGLTGNESGREEIKTRAENREALKQFIGRIYREFGRGFGQTIILAFFEELGGMRITVPTIKELAQEDRDRRIRLQFNGINYVELAVRWGLSDRQVRRIVNGA